MMCVIMTTGHRYARGTGTEAELAQINSRKNTLRVSSTGLMGRGRGVAAAGFNVQCHQPTRLIIYFQ
jgi:hypothetical protein